MSPAPRAASLEPDALPAEIVATAAPAPPTPTTARAEEKEDRSLSDVTLTAHAGGA